MANRGTIIVLAFFLVLAVATVSPISNSRQNGHQRVNTHAHVYSFPGANVRFRIRSNPRYVVRVYPNGAVYGKTPPVGQRLPTPTRPFGGSSVGVPATSPIKRVPVQQQTVSQPPTEPLVSNDITGVKIMSENCRYYCRRQEGDIYCCENDMDPINRPTVKSGICPQSNSVCELINSVVIPCSNDARCPDTDKCCYDPCLRRHTCIQPSTV